MNIRLLGLSTKFTQALFGEVMETKMEQWDSNEYQANLNSIFSKYTTKDIVKLSNEYCKFH